VAEAAAECANSKRSIFRWLSESDEFPRRVQQIQDELFRTTAARLCASGLQAARKLGELIDSEDKRIALRACCAVLDHCLKWHDAVWVRQQMEELRQKLEALERGQGHPG
jgi:hypothetical protein